MLLSPTILIISKDHHFSHPAMQATDGTIYNITISYTQPDQEDLANVPVFSLISSPGWNPGLQAVGGGV